MSHERGWDPGCPTARDLVRPVPLDPTGELGPTRARARGLSWRRTTIGFYVPAGVSDQRVEQRILEQAMRLGPTGAVTGWAALRLHRGGFFDGLDRDGVTRLPVSLVLGTDRRRPHPDVTLSREPLHGEEIVLRQGVRCVGVERAVFDEMRRTGDRREAVVVLDMACAAELTSIKRMRAHLAGRAGWRGVRLVQWALDHASETSRSPAEPRFRLIWEVDAGWPRPLCNRPVQDLEGRLLGVPDLIDDELGIVGEYDGADHRTRRRHRRDVEREAAFRRAGLECVTVVGEDLHEPALVVDRMQAARSRAGARPRAWRLGPLGPTLDERLDEQDQARSMVEL